MKQTGIIMSGIHPKLILDLLKTQTRRTSGLNRINKHPDDWTIDLQGDIAAFRNIHTGEDALIRCPYGQVGDRLWVREAHTWVTLGENDPWKDRAIADGSFRRDYDGNPVTMVFKADGYEIGSSWRPSIHMPRWASRITLEITEVRVEGVQEISYWDAGKEGLDDVLAEWMRLAEFQELWDSLNAKRGYGWGMNPWVWVLIFKLLEQPK